MPVAKVREIAPSEGAGLTALTKLARLARESADGGNLAGIVAEFHRI
jgi:hypothetical protein